MEAVELSAELNQWNAAGRRIRTELPCTGKDGRATDADCRARDAAVRAQLDEWGIHVDGLRHVWFTCILEDGQICGVWSDSIQHAAVTQSLWWDRDVVRILEDADAAAHTRWKAAQKAERKITDRLQAQYVDESTTGQLLSATVAEGMLF